MGSDYAESVFVCFHLTIGGSTFILQTCLLHLSSNRGLLHVSSVIEAFFINLQSSRSSSSMFMLLCLEYTGTSSSMGVFHLGSTRPLGVAGDLHSRLEFQLSTL